MNHLPHYKWYLACAAMVALARWSVLAFFVLLLSTQFTHTFPKTLIAVAFGVLAVCGISVLAVALWLRCPNCTERVLLTWNPDNPENRRIQSLPWRDRAKDIFFPSELASREVRCVHCGIRLQLRGEA